MGGKCGICGDPWGDSPREHEAPGGRYANGIIAQTYKPGQIIDVNIEVTANHKGYFIFRLCANNNVKQDPDQECFDRLAHLLLMHILDNLLLFLLSYRNVLKVVPHMEDRFNLTTSSVGTYSLKLQLPGDVVCDQCILQVSKLRDFPS